MSECSLRIPCDDLASKGGVLDSVSSLKLNVDEVSLLQAGGRRFRFPR